MNKKSLGLVTILILIIGGLVYAKSRTPDSIAISNSDSPSELLTKGAKFARAMQSGEPYTCQITSDKASMTYQLKDHKMYMTTVTPEHSSYMINDLEYIYSWSNQSDQGSKMAVPTEEDMEELEEMADSLPESSDLPAQAGTPSFATESDYQAFEQQGYTVNCKAGGVDDSIFTPPSNITFIDPSAMMQGLAGDDGQIDMAKLQEMAKEYESN